MSYTYTTQGFTVSDAGRRLVIDPITRIEGHLRCEVNLDNDNVITNAVSCGTLFRGLEIILRGRDPREAWAFTERICGVCTGSHALASVRAVENALGIDIPANANLLRNLMHLALWFHDHLVHFYHLGGLDWINVVSAAKGDPAGASKLAQSISTWPENSPGYFNDVRHRLNTILQSGQLGLFTNGYWNHPGYRLPPDANLMLVGHYLQALDFQKESVKIHTVFGGKNPHPNWLVGGVPTAINLHGVGGADVISNERLELVDKVISRCQDFAEQVLVPDALALCQFYPEWFHIGTGLSNQSVLSYGGFPAIANDYTAQSLQIPAGAVINGRFDEIHPVDLKDPEEIQETVDHSWYTYPNLPEKTALSPFNGITLPHYALGPNAKGTPTDIRQLDEQARYSWIKTPTWHGHTMEVGPLARTLIAYHTGTTAIKDAVDDACSRLNIPVKSLCSTMGRILSRVLEARWSAQAMRATFNQLVSNIKNGDSTVVNTSKWEPETWPQTARGVGFVEAPRGALGHWISIREGQIEQYQCVVPTTWNAAPRSPSGLLGAYEASLMNTRMAMPEQPLEILRTIHSFDPCLACSTHILGANGKEITVAFSDGR